MMYYMARHGLAGRMGWGPKYTVVVLQHQAHKGLDQVSQVEGEARQLCSYHVLCVLVQWHQACQRHHSGLLSFPQEFKLACDADIIIYMMLLLLLCAAVQAH
jgi:hypothetical protein